jgi:hypothetical protein
MVVLDDPGDQRLFLSFDCWAWALWGISCMWLLLPTSG